MKNYLQALVVAALMLGAAPQSFAAVEGKYVKTPTGYLVVLRPGDNLNAHLTELVEREKIQSASLTGIGFLGEVKFAYYDANTKQYLSKTMNDVELMNLTGSLAWKDEKPSAHLHATVSGRDYLAYGGHVQEAVVGKGTLELFITTFDRKLTRAVDPEVGANALQLKQQ